MAQTIRRNAKPVRRQARDQGAKTKVRTAKQTTNSFVDALMRILPFTEEQLHKTFLVLILAGSAALAWLVASMAGRPPPPGPQVALGAAGTRYEKKPRESLGGERPDQHLAARARGAPQSAG